MSTNSTSHRMGLFRSRWCNSSTLVSRIGRGISIERLLHNSLNPEFDNSTITSLSAFLPISSVFQIHVPTTEIPRPKKDGPANAETRSGCSPGPSSVSWKRRTCEERGSRRSRELPTRDQGGRIITAGRPVKGTGRDPAQESTPRTRDPMPCPGVALLWRSSENPGGTSTADWKRGGLVG